MQSKEYRLFSASYEAQGPRKTMEDTHIRIDNVKMDNEISQSEALKNFNNVAYYGVYDGHGGVQTAEMVVKKLHFKIFNSVLFASGDVAGAIHKGFQEMDQFVVEEANKLNSMHGCTCVCTLILDNKMYCANIGDSEAILVSVSNGLVQPKNMTKAHKASEPSEKERIESMGGHVFFGRVYGSLAVSRSFGDAKYKRPKTSKDFVSWEPHILVEDLQEHHRYIILACDGLFDVMNHQEVADYVHKLFEEGKEPQQVAKALVVKAVRDLQTEDNCTVIVIRINWSHPEPRLTEEGTNNNKEEVNCSTPTSNGENSAMSHSDAAQLQSKSEEPTNTSPPSSSTSSSSTTTDTEVSSDPTQEQKV